MAPPFRKFLDYLLRLRSRFTTRKHSPPTVEWLLEHRTERLESRALSQGRTPTASLYRMYEYLVVGSSNGLRTEIEFFFNQPTWKVADIPDPADGDPRRYAILAGLPFYLVKAFNRLIERGLPRGSPAIIAGDDAERELQNQAPALETEPSWVSKISPLPDTLVIPTADAQEPAEEKRSERYRSLNILVQEPHVLFV